MIKKRIYSLAMQYGATKSKYPNFTCFISKNKLIIKGFIRPTSRSEIYTFKLWYITGEQPIVKIINPILKKNLNGENIPHTYPQKKLCLFYPNYQEFTSSMFISDTVIPWISLWLYHYENWHLTGDWMGGGIHPN